jgi:hypothetical protein
MAALWRRKKTFAVMALIPCKREEEDRKAEIASWLIIVLII